MNIAIFTDNFLPGVGGTENAVKNFAEELVKKNHNVIVFAPEYHKNFKDEFSFNVVRIKSIAVTKNDCCALPNFDGNLKQKLKEFNPQVIHTETLGPISNFAIKYAKKNNIFLVSTVHTKYRFCYYHATHLKLLTEILVHHYASKLKYANVISTVSHDMIKELNSYGIKKDICVIKNGGIKRNNAFEKTNNSIFTCLFVGLVVKYKNIGFSLNALKIVKDKGYNFVFNIVGSGQDEKYFQKKVAKLGLKDNVKFLGRITDAVKLDEIYSQSDLFLFPSIFDSDGLVLCEAGNMGTPSIVIKGTCASERIVDGKTGFVSENNVESFADKIIYLMNNREQLASAGNEAKNLFTSWNDNVEKYLEIYKKAN